MKTQITRSLRSQITSLVFSGLLVATLLFGLFAVTQASRRIQLVDHRKGESLSHIMAHSLAPLLLFSDIEALDLQIQNLKQDSTILSAWVLDLQKKPLHEAETRILPNQYPQKPEQVFIEEINWNGHRATLFTTPVFQPASEKQQGYFCLVQNDEEREKAVKGLRESILLTGLGILLLIALGLFWRISKRFAPLGEVNRLMESISTGSADLTVRLHVTSQDEISQLANSFNLFIAKLETLMSQIKQNTISVSSASHQMSATTEELSATFEEQNGQMRMIEESIREIAAMADTVQTLTGNMRTGAETASEMTRNGAVTIQSSIHSLGSIQTHTDRLEAMLHSLNRSMKKIVEITTFIGSIAEQTNLLALNAAIEAARAGHAGRGFSVVADEVRKLSESAAESSDEIFSIVTGLTREAQSAVVEMQKASDEVRKSSNLGQESLSQLEGIIHSSDQIVAAASEVAQAITSHNTTIMSVNQSISEITQASDESAKAIGEVAQTSEDLSHQSDELKSTVERFKTEN